jgi:hypothetical protein
MTPRMVLAQAVASDVEVSSNKVATTLRLARGIISEKLDCYVVLHLWGKAFTVFVSVDPGTIPRRRPGSGGGAFQCAQLKVVVLDT